MLTIFNCRGCRAWLPRRVVRQSLRATLGALQEVDTRHPRRPGDVLVQGRKGDVAEQRRQPPPNTFHDFWRMSPFVFGYVVVAAAGGFPDRDAVADGDLVRVDEDVLMGRRSTHWCSRVLAVAALARNSARKPSRSPTSLR
jgi:hypothetical protein